MKELNELNLPNNVKYQDSHEWISTSAPCRVGISDYAQDALGDLIFVEMPEVGAKLTCGEEFGTLESTKNVSPLLSPVSGTVTAVNEKLADSPDLVNTDPYGEGWLIEVTPDSLDLDTLMDAQAYQALLEAEH